LSHEFLENEINEERKPLTKRPTQTKRSNHAKEYCIAERRKELELAIVSSIAANHQEIYNQLVTKQKG